MADMTIRGPDCDDCEGEQGERGERGKRGKRGKRGRRGPDGHDGQDGATGPTGPAETGATGPTGPAASSCDECLQNIRLGRIEDALNGDLVLAIFAPNPELISAAALNAAPAGTFRRSFTAALRTAEGGVHSWAAFAPTLVPGESVADPSVAPPTVVGAPAFAGGLLTVEIVLDTDAGATKTYVPGDAVTVQVRVSPSDQLLGWPVASVTKTFNVVA